MTQNVKLFGYARVSSTDQDLTIQIDALMKARQRGPHLQREDVGQHT